MEEGKLNFFIPVLPQVQAIVYRQLLSRSQVEDLISPSKAPNYEPATSNHGNITSNLLESTHCKNCRNSIYSIEKYCQSNRDECAQEDLKDLHILRVMMAEFYPRGEVLTCDPEKGQLVHQENL